jgi:NAD-dependent dihydropyrimidine dehydrogenase PreA subunit
LYPGFNPKNIWRNRYMAVKVDTSKCDACGSCAEVCPVEAIKVKDKAVVNEDECIDCGTCVDECPNDALEL